jgi:hypothetical protein
MTLGNMREPGVRICLPWDAGRAVAIGTQAPGVETKGSSTTARVCVNRPETTELNGERRDKGDIQRAELAGMFILASEAKRETAASQVRARK